MQHFWHKGAVVGTVHSPSCLDALLRGEVALPDAIEIRLDSVSPTAEQLAAIPAPIILTPRGKREGGARDWDFLERCEAAFGLLDFAAAVDIELADVTGMQPLVDICRRKGTALIFSHHDFSGMPGTGALESLYGEATSAGAEIFKLAVTPDSPRHLAVLLEFLDGKTNPPLSLMGMGKYGKISRLLFGVSGSVLNYGWLHSPQVPGQLPAQELRTLLTGLLPEAQC